MHFLRISRPFGSGHWIMLSSCGIYKKASGLAGFCFYLGIATTCHISYDDIQGKPANIPQAIRSHTKVDLWLSKRMESSTNSSSWDTIGVRSQLTIILRVYSTKDKPRNFLTELYFANNLTWNRNAIDVSVRPSWSIESRLSNFYAMITVMRSPVNKLHYSMSKNYLTCYRFYYIGWLI